MNKNPKNIEEGLVDAIAKSDVKSIGIDIAELSLDALMKDGLAKDIPIVSWLFAGYKIYDTISDRILAKKILNFLSGVEEASQEKRQEFITSLENPKKLQEVGEQLLLMISKYDDFRKTKLLGYFFAALTIGEITIDEFYRISTIIDKVYFDDFKKLEGIPNEYVQMMKNKDDEMLQGFKSIGLIIEKQAVLGSDDNFYLRIRHFKSEIAIKMIKVFNKYQNDLK